MNENLQNALKTAGLSIEQFAEVIQVDPKSVQRWVTGATVPYPRHRARIASALDLSEADLWPGQVPEPTATTSADALAVGAAIVSEVTGTWAYNDDPGTPDLVALITGTDGDIDVYDARPDIVLSDPLLVAAILEQARAGRQVRVLSTRPTMRLAPLIGQPGIRVRMADSGWQTLVRAGNKIIHTFTMTYVGEQPGLLLLERKTDDGLFDRIRDEFHSDWQDTDLEDTDITTLELLHHYAEPDGDEPDDPAKRDEGQPGRIARPEAAAANPTEGGSRPPLPAGEQHTTARRWPG